MKLYEEFKLWENLWESITGELVDTDGNKIEATSYLTFDDGGWPDYSPGFKKLEEHMFEVLGAPFHASAEPRYFRATYVIDQKAYELRIDPCADESRNRKSKDGWVEVWAYEVYELIDYTEGSFSGSWIQDWTRINRKERHVAGNMFGARYIASYGPCADGPKTYEEVLNELFKLGLISDKSKCI